MQFTVVRSQVKVSIVLIVMDNVHHICYSTTVIDGYT